MVQVTDVEGFCLDVEAGRWGDMVALHALASAAAVNCEDVGPRCGRRAIVQC
jgi:hypothetical protein